MRPYNYKQSRIKSSAPQILTFDLQQANQGHDRLSKTKKNRTEHNETLADINASSQVMNEAYQPERVMARAHNPCVERLVFFLFGALVTFVAVFVPMYLKDYSKLGGSFIQGSSNCSCASCTDSLATCNADLATCNTGWSAANASLSACTNSTCASSLANCSTSLTACYSSLSSINSSLSSCLSSLSVTNASLVSCTSSSSAGQLATCNTNLASCYAGWSAANASSTSSSCPTSGYTIFLQTPLCVGCSGPPVVCTFCYCKQSCGFNPPVSKAKTTIGGVFYGDYGYGNCQVCSNGAYCQ